ncbi:MAG: hypothetical protein KKD44_07010 [Proteobacteria bacterium]|nr:hypothetical protein [Pseudomonadota bacterium]
MYILHHDIYQYIRDLIATIIFSCLTLVSCGSSDSSPPAPPSKTITGTAAAGAPIAGVVRVKGSLGHTATSPIELDGHFSLDVSALAAPYMLCAEGSVNGKSIKIFSAGVDEGCINITPVTDFIVRNALASAPGDAFDAWDGSQIGSGDLSAAETLVQTQIAPLLSAMGVSDDSDLISSPFNADSTGMDLVLEALEFSINGTVVTVTNRLTGSVFTNDVSTQSDDGNGLPLDDADLIAVVLQDNEDINAIWDILENLYHDSVPSPSELNAFAALMADDFLENGASKQIVLDQWLTGDGGPEAEMSLTSTLRSSLDIGGTLYQKGYLIRLHYEGPHGSDVFDTAVVYDGNTWLWWGNRSWLETEAKANGFMSVLSGTTTLQTGIDFNLNDDTGYAYDHDVRSAVVTGPGLPTGGVVYEHMYPDSDFYVYNPSGSNTHFYVIDNDDDVSDIPDNAEYTFTLCEEDAETIYSGVSCTARYTRTESIGKAPVRNADLNTSYFVTLTSPPHHMSSLLNFGGPISASWTIPHGYYADEALLVWDSGGTQYHVSEDLGPQSTSVTLDTTGLPAPYGWAGLFISVEDEFGRWFNMGWSFQ